MRTHKLYFERIPVSSVKEIVDRLPQEVVDRLPEAKKENGNDWRELAQRVQLETDSNKMVKLVEQLIQKFDEEKLAKSRASYRAKDREASQL
jgi:hypothetical protein